MFCVCCFPPTDSSLWMIHRNKQEGFDGFFHQTSRVLSSPHGGTPCRTSAAESNNTPSTRSRQILPAGLVSARAVEDICQAFTWLMMTNVWCVTVLCIDLKGLLQHVVHENNSKIVAILTSKCYETVVSCEKKARFFILQHHHHSLWDNF